MVHHRAALLFAVSYVYSPSFTPSSCPLLFVFHFACHRIFLVGCPFATEVFFTVFSCPVVIMVLKAALITAVVFIILVLFSKVILPIIYLPRLELIRRRVPSLCQKLPTCTRLGGIDLFFHILFLLLWPSG